MERRTIALICYIASLALSIAVAFIANSNSINMTLNATITWIAVSVILGVVGRLLLLFPRRP